MPLLLENVVTLQKALTHLTDLDQRLSGVPEDMRELHEQHTSGTLEIERLGTIIDEATAERRQTEAATQDLAVKLEHYREQVNRVTTQREYAAILQEIDLVKEQTRALEDQALAAMERQDEAETELGTLRESFSAVDDQYQIEMKKWEAAKPGVVEEADTLRDEIEGLREQIPNSSLLLFERIRDFNSGHALAPIRHVTRSRSASMWHCGGCNYNVRPQIVVEIKNHGSLIQCDSCKRLLFIEESAD